MVWIFRPKLLIQGKNPSKVGHLARIFDVEAAASDGKDTVGGMVTDPNFRLPENGFLEYILWKNKKLLSDCPAAWILR